MTTADLIKNVRQRCGDVNAISPAAEPLLTSIIEGVAVEALTAGKNQADQGPLAQAAVLGKQPIGLGARISPAC